MIDPSGTPSLEDSMQVIRSWSIRSRPVNQATVVSSNMVIGDGVNTIPTGIQGLLQLDFNGAITGFFIQEFDGLTGSVRLDIQKAARGPAPVFTSIVGVTPPILTTGRYYPDEVLAGWITDFVRGECLRIHVITVATFRRLSLDFRTRRKEPISG